MTSTTAAGTAAGGTIMAGRQKAATSRLLLLLVVVVVLLTSHRMYGSVWGPQFGSGRRAFATGSHDVNSRAGLCSRPASSTQRHSHLKEARILPSHGRARGMRRSPQVFNRKGPSHMVLDPAGRIVLDIKIRALSRGHAQRRLTCGPWLASTHPNTNRHPTENGASTQLSHSPLSLESKTWQRELACSLSPFS